MPQSRRDEWNKAIADRKTVPFTEEAVRPTIADLLASRHKFFASAWTVFSEAFLEPM